MDRLKHSLRDGTQQLNILTAGELEAWTGGALRAAAGSTRLTAFEEQRADGRGRRLEIRSKLTEKQNPDGQNANREIKYQKFEIRDSDPMLYAPCPMPTMPSGFSGLFQLTLLRSHLICPESLLCDSYQGCGSGQF
jgi:hypothetical protein